MELWQDSRHRLPIRHQPSSRPAGECLGELVQIDGSEHAWFEGDATSRLKQRRFVASESAFDCFRSTRA
jgi:hypothetical protein